MRTKTRLFILFVGLFVSFCLYGCNKNDIPNDKSVSHDVSKSANNVDISDLNEQTIENNKKKSDTEDVYLNFMKNDNFANPFDENGKPHYAYVYYDIDSNGVDELIIKGGYANYQVYSVINDEVEMIGYDKYGSDLTVYPDSHVFFWNGGRKDDFYQEYFIVSSDGAEEIASKSWSINPKTMKKENTVYKVDNKKSKKNSFEKKVSMIKKGRKIRENELDWIK